jgi:uncharacterized protein (TIGR00255 family)
MIHSMTAFARAEKTKQKLTVTVEIRSYNSRHLDIALRMPHGYLCLEDKIKGLISNRVARGRIEMSIRIKNNSDETYAFEINESLAEAFHEALIRLQDKFNIGTGVTLDLLTGIEGVIMPSDINRDVETCWLVIHECMNEAFDDLVAMRKREGDIIARDFTQRLDYIEKIIARIEQETSGLVSVYQERLKDRISFLTKGIVEIDPARIAQEAALLADRSDISEEILRAKSHIKQFRTIMDSEKPSGKKLNFLLQEFNREFNTMGSKTVKADVSHIIVDVKSELEKIREQVQNVE